MMRMVEINAVLVLLMLAIGCNQTTELQESSSAEGSEATKTLSENEPAPGSSTIESPSNAEEILASVLSTAAIESKYVLVHLGAPG